MGSWSSLSQWLCSSQHHGLRKGMFQLELRAETTANEESDNLQLCEEELPQKVEGQKDEGGSPSRTGVRVNTA